MTIERLELRAARAWSMRALPWLCGAAALLVLSCAHGSEARHGDRLDVSAYPPEIQRDYAVFARRCSRCHTLARPLNAQIRDPQHWVRYVTRMRRNPSSGINRDDAALILDFLLFYTARTQQQEEQASEPPPASTQPKTKPDSDDKAKAHETPRPAGATPSPAPATNPSTDDPASSTPIPATDPSTDDAAGAPPSPAPAPAPASEGALP
ncbi:MAG TPA: hypothetical protein VK509_09265 [Polyangiales bacterium]|nr:hypothetical protein [Polyangiales bacterium]